MAPVVAKPRETMPATDKPTRNPATGSVPFRERLTCSINQAAEAIGTDRRTVYRLIKRGAIETTTIPGVEGQVVRVRSLLALVGDDAAGPE